MTDRKQQLLSRTQIAVDMDHVMADTGSYLCDWTNRRFGTSFSDESFKTLRDKLPDDECAELVDFVANGKLMRDLPVMDGCRDVMEELSGNYAIAVCTAAMEYPNTIMPKIDWLHEYFPFLEPQLFIFCGYKQVLGSAYLIDDSPKHFGGFTGTPLLYSAPHNHDETQYERVDNWSDVAAYFEL